ncbi:hypothetical protein [Angustibacter speluncae]
MGAQRQLPLRERVRHAATADLNADEMREIASDPHHDVRGELAARENLPEDVINSLANDKSAAVRGLIARHARASHELVARLSQDKSPLVQWEVVWAIADRPDLAATVLPVAKQHVLLVLADRFASMDEVIQQALGRHVDPEVRCKVAEQAEDIPLLASLASDTEPRVRRAVAANPHISRDLQLQLASDPHRMVRAGVADNWALDPDVALVLTSDRSKDVRLVLATRLHSYAHVQARLRDDPDGMVRHHATELGYAPRPE